VYVDDGDGALLATDDAAEYMVSQNNALREKQQDIARGSEGRIKGDG
jgi:hypothetical protein